MRLHEMQAEQLIDILEERQEETIKAEAEESRTKAMFESVKGALLLAQRSEGVPMEAAKSVIQGLPQYQNALEGYLEAHTAYERARAAQDRASKAINLWQTTRADNRRI